VYLVLFYVLAFVTSLAGFAVFIWASWQRVRPVMRGPSSNSAA
jgi:hypothetical protein